MVDKMDQLSIYSNNISRPLAYKMRPTNLDDFVGQEKSMNIIKKFIEKKNYQI